MASKLNDIKDSFVSVFGSGCWVLYPAGSPIGSVLGSVWMPHILNDGTIIE